MQVSYRMIKLFSYAADVHDVLREGLKVHTNRLHETGVAVVFRRKSDVMVL